MFVAKALLAVFDTAGGGELRSTNVCTIVLVAKALLAASDTAGGGNEEIGRAHV